MMNSKSFSQERDSDVQQENEDDDVYSVELDELKVYTLRFGISALFCLACFSNQIMWVTFVPISNLAESYLDVSTIAINWLSIIWLVTYLPGTYIQAKMMERYGLRTSVVFGAMLTVVGALLRVFGAALRFAGGSFEISEGWQYAFQFLGQFIASIAQPIFLNLPGNVSSAWFPPNERDLSTTVASVCGPIGNALGSILPSLFVKAGDSMGQMEESFLNLLICELVVAVVAFALVYLYFESRPPTPPSESERMRQRLLDTGKSDDYNSNNKKIEASIRTPSMSYGRQSDLESRVADLRSVFSSPPPVPESSPNTTTSVWQQLRWLANNRNYVLLFTAYSLGLGVFNLILTLVNQIMEPYGYSNDEAGYCNFALIVTGIVGAVASGKTLETYKAYDVIIKVGYFGSLVSILILIEALEVNFPFLCFAFSLLGFFIVPLLPAAIECCAEITYPYVSEDIAVGAIFVSGNLTGAVFAFVGEILLENYDANQIGEGKVSPFLQPSNVFCVAITILSCIIIFYFKGNYNRLGFDYVLDDEVGSPVMRHRHSADRRGTRSGETESGWTLHTFNAYLTGQAKRRGVSKDSALERGLLDTTTDVSTDMESDTIASPPPRRETGTYSIASTDDYLSSVSVANSQRDTIQASHSPVKQALYKLSSSASPPRALIE